MSGLDLLDSGTLVARLLVVHDILIRLHSNAPIAQLAEAPDLKSVKCGFESHWGHWYILCGLRLWRQNAIGGFPQRTESSGNRISTTL